MGKGSLRGALKSQKLEWRTRYEIALGISQALEYMHHDCHPPIVHRALKSANILLDDDYTPHIAGFGLARLIEDQSTHRESNSYPVSAGTLGYMAPECGDGVKASTKQDFFSLGIVLMELIIGRPTIFEEEGGDSALGFSGVLKKVDELKATIPSVYMLDQFTNPANPDAHFQSTGPEIWQDTAGKVDIFVSGSGTGGTISGVGRYLKMRNPSIKVVCVEPSESPIISGGQKGIHTIQGISPGFIPENLDMAVIDEIITVSSEEAIMFARRIAREEGLLVGISSGAAFAAALKVGKRSENKGKLITMILPSPAER
ncbi:hypothetical protein KI387_000264, partial [Taxus chinensis]